jgi:uncharacterized membrane protein YdbT with pleckstrin-like domain
MGFPRKMLNDGEDVILDLTPHWSTMARPVGAVVVMLIATLAAVVFTSVTPLQAALAVILLVTVGWAGIKVLERQNTNFVVTTDRIVYRSGVIAKHGKEIPLERVNDISFHQSVFERLIGTGDLSIESAGAQSRETFSDIPKPSLVQNEIYRRMEAREDRHAGGGMAVSATLSIPEQIEKLDQLRQQGVLTQAEFDAQKAKLLG